MTNNPTDGFRLSRRTILRSAATGAVLLGSGALAACATGGAGGGTEPTEEGGGAEKSAENPFGVVEGTPMEVVIFDGGYGQEYGKAHVEMYNEMWGGGAKMTATVKIGSTLQPRFSSGEPPEVIDNSGADAMPVAQLVAQNQLADLQAVLDAPSIDDPNVKIGDLLLPGAKESGSFDGVMRQLGYVFSMWGIWYSKPLFEEKGWEPATTMDDFMALCEKIKSEGSMAPYIHTGVHSQYMANVLCQMAVKHGGNDVLLKIDNLEPDAWTNDSILAAAKAWEEVAAAGFILPAAVGMDHTTSQTEWLNGAAAMIPCGSWLENEMKGKVPDGFDMVVQALPSLTAEDAMPQGAISGGSGEPFILPTKAKNHAGGQEYLRVMLSNAGTSKFAELTGNLAAVKGAGDNLTDPSSALASVAEVSGAAGEDIFEVKFMTWYAALKTAATDATRNLMSGKMTADQYSATMQAAVDQVAKDPKVQKFERT
ncbi:N-acetylglucosamine/diacetylchitobiose ABC transporter substrate-binding protein [Propionibacteriaceae bacterium Y2011]|uniref:N-acetylglucosamine/diacetylchitobiose ABC transporter substrate-binding protein n=1 Tax=Microlunatus sp. Y2014 TaxID=3418488 RepID=UPI003B44B203